MKRTEIIALFTIFVSVFVLVGVLRYLNLYEGMEHEGLDNDEETEETEPPMLEGLDVPAAPPSPPASGGPVPAAPPSPPASGGPVPAAAGSVLKFSTF